MTARFEEGATYRIGSRTRTVLKTFDDGERAVAYKYDYLGLKAYVIAAPEHWEREDV